MVIHAPTPARLLTEFHDKHVLVIGQEHRRDIALEYPFLFNYVDLTKILKVHYIITKYHHVSSSNEWIFPYV